MSPGTPAYLSNVKQDYLFIAALLLMTVLLYAHTLSFAFVWDDLIYVQGSDAFRSFDVKGMLLALGNGVEYLPVRDLTFALDFLLWGDRPGGFHFSNVLFYTITVLLVYRVTLQLAKLLRPTIEPALASRTAFITACIFALHPLHVEPASFVNGRNALVSGMFFFLCLLAYLRYLERGGKKVLVASLAFFVLAVFSKATALALPLVMTLVAFTHSRSFKSRLPELSVFFLIALVAFALFREVAQSSHIIRPDQYYELSMLSPGTRIATSLQIIFFYMGKFIVPIGLSVDYTPEFSSSLLSAKAGTSLFALFVIVYCAWRYRQRFPEGLFALLAYISLLLPVLNLFLTSPVVADRYAYLPLYPLAIVTASALVMTVRGKTLVVAAGLLCLGLGALSFERSRVWENDEKLWQATMDRSPDSALAIFNLSNSYFDRGSYELAIQIIDRLAALKPYSIAPQAMRARVAMTRGEYSEAIETLENAMLEKEANNEAFLYLAEAYEATGRYEKAVHYYLKVLHSEETALRERRVAEGRLNALRPVLLAGFESELAAVRGVASDAQRLSDLAIRLDQAGLDDEALNLYQRLESEHGAHWGVSLNIANIYLQRGDAKRAADHFQRSISLKPDNAQAFNGLGIALRRSGDFPGAEGAFLDAIRLAPDYAKAPLNLAVMYLQLDRKDEARRYFEYTARRFPELEKRVEAYLSRM